MGIRIARVQLCATFANILLAGEEDLAGGARVGVGLGWAGLQGHDQSLVGRVDQHYLGVLWHLLWEQNGCQGQGKQGLAGGKADGSLL